jgi:hypothetical protein
MCSPASTACWPPCRGRDQGGGATAPRWPEPSLSYLALGDSYTIGEAVAVEGRWPHQLAAALRAQDVALADPQTIATTGWTTDELDAGIDAAAPQGPFDFVSLLIGVNNQYRGRRWTSTAASSTPCCSGRSALPAAAQGVLVLSFPDWGATFGAGGDGAAVEIETDEFNAAAEVISTQQGVAFVDITASRPGADP